MALHSNVSLFAKAQPAVFVGLAVVLIGALLGWYGEGFPGVLVFILLAILLFGIAITLLVVALVRRGLGLSFQWTTKASKQFAIVATFLIVGVVVSGVSNEASVALSKRRAKSITVRLERFYAARMRYPETLAELKRTDGVAIPRPTISREPFGYYRSDSFYTLSFHGNFIAFYTYRSDTHRWYDEDDNED